MNNFYYRHFIERIQALNRNLTHNGFQNGGKITAYRFANIISSGANSMIQKKLKNFEKKYFQPSIDIVLAMYIIWMRQVGVWYHMMKKYALRGSDEVVFERNDNYPSKYKFTAIATINAAGEKLPMITVAKGKTIRCEKSFQTIFGNIVMHTQNGWSTENLMLAYLQWLSDRCQNSPICLIWDQYKAHMTDKVKEQATKLKIEIIYIPAGQTGSEQPLDKLIFGSMKKTADRIWSEKLLIDEKNLSTKETATIIMLEAWDSIKESTVSKSWNHFFSSSDDLTEINNDFDWVPENEDGDNDD